MQAGHSPDLLNQTTFS